MTTAKMIADINKKYGENSIMLAKDMPVYPSVPSGSLALDFAIGIGGLPPDRVIEVAGEEGCGKTTLGLLSMIEFMDADPKRSVMILDLEHKLTKSWIEYIVGTERWDSGRILYAQPEHLEQATNMYVDLVGTGEISFVLLDSIGGAATKAVMEKDAEKIQMGGAAQVVGKFGKLAASHSAKFKCCTFCVNQVRADMDGYHRHITPGGQSIKHNFVLRIKLRKSTSDKKIVKINGEDIQIGYLIKATTVKNQLAAPGRTAEYWFLNVPTEEFGFGVDTTEECVRLAIATGVVTGGSWLTHPALPADAKGEHKVNGKLRLMEMVRNDEALRKTIVSETMARLENNKSLLSEVAPMDADAVEAD